MRWPEATIKVSFENFVEEYKLITFGQPVNIPQTEVAAHMVTTPQKGKVEQTVWQEAVADVLVNVIGISASSEQNEELKTLGENIIHRGEISWELLADYWANVGEEYSKKWRNQ